MTKDWRNEARRRLLELQQGPGLWGYRARSAPAVEASTLASLALLATDLEASKESQATALSTARWLSTIRRPDGSLGVTTQVLEPGWATPFAMLLWAAVDGFASERSTSLAWLVELQGGTSPRTKDDPMGHDTTIVGWPWVARTHSWVEPTAMALLAMSRVGQGAHPRVREGVRLLHDRAIPGGGWNLGNPVVFGTPLRPLPAPTGLAMLALAGLEQSSQAIDSAASYLRSALAETFAPTSLGWGLMGLRAWSRKPSEASGWLSRAFDRIDLRDPQAAELALLLLAEGPRSLELLGIKPRNREVSGHE